MLPFPATFQQTQLNFFILSITKATKDLQLPFFHTMKFFPILFAVLAADIVAARADCPGQIAWCKAQCNVPL